jgi:PAS domain S-box-containing protein
MPETNGGRFNRLSQHDAIMFADCDGIIRLWNSGAEKMFGFTAGEALDVT